MNAASAGPGYVLVVDDDPDIRDALCFVIEGAGYEVRSADNGREALERMRTEARPAVVILDLMMPVMNGWQFRDEQSRDPALADVPVVVLTGDGRIAAKAATLGAQGYLKKPVELSALLATVASHAPRRKD
jgi:CheY-like chemotaxis protein